MAKPSKGKAKKKNASELAPKQIPELGWELRRIPDAYTAEGGRLYTLDEINAEIAEARGRRDSSSQRTGVRKQLSSSRSLHVAGADRRNRD